MITSKQNEFLLRINPGVRLKLDDCSHCACYTSLIGYSIDKAISELEEGTLGCDNCMEDDDGHHTCVALMNEETDEVYWDGRHEMPA